MKKLFPALLILISVASYGQIINFPDPLLKAKLRSIFGVTDVNGNTFHLDSNDDNEIDVAEASMAYGANVSSYGISNMSGIEYFVNLRKLNCRDNNLASLNVQPLIHLEDLDCGYNNITVLGIAGMGSLKKLTCTGNQLSAIDFSGLNNLEWLSVVSNPLQNINLSALSSLKEFYCHYTPLTSVNLSGLTNLVHVACNFNDDLASINISGCYNLTEILCYWNNLDTLQMDGCYNLKHVACGDNNLASIDLTTLINLEQLACADNHIAHLDLSHQPKFRELYCPGNSNMQTINLKNGITETLTNLTTNLNLQYICADEAETPTLMAYLTSNSITGCEVNSYCTFTPGGNYFTMSGNNTFDSDNNGCGSGDNPFPHLLFQITNTTSALQNGYISDGSGAYAIPVTAGSYSLAPIIENPTYFNVDPSILNADFEIGSSSIMQDFCITPNGIHPDLEVTLIPLNIARPGFDATYKILLKNKGNQTQSGSVRLAYDDDILDFVSSNPGILFQSAGLLVFDFDELQPFGVEEILVTFNLNSPMENPAVNGGDVLHYTASIITAADETPINNTFILNQTVVNSFDPNDKTCLEGNTITPEMVGKEVHYMIRFENTGTANAENIVVKDMIDTTKFDINSLIPIDGSHPFVTRISNTNKVEFLFENINLPFDDANNDGYVAFKIKTKPTLVLGDTFSNTASIYFDYNFPIVTDPAVTTVALLANQDFEFADYFKIYPNPVNDVLNIETKKNIAITSINIYNTLGQLVLVIPNAQQTKSVDVSGLKTGNYFLKINSGQGSSSVKFVKM